MPDVEPGTTVSEGRFSAFISPGIRIESTPDVVVLADEDVTNLDELSSLLGLRRSEPNLFAALYDMEGPTFVRRLRGAFAIALWEARQQRLVLAVDHVGIRRLHYAGDAGSMAFASRVAALRAAPGVSADVDLTSVYHYLNFGYTPAPHTPFAGVRRLPPGHVLVVQDGRATLEAYWDMTYPEHTVSERQSAPVLYSLTEAAVKRALTGIDGKERGAFLSGGTDSSTVVGLMTRTTGEPAHAFSIGFDDRRYDEVGYAGITARHFGATHHTRLVTPDDALAALPRLVDAYDEPFANSSALGTLICAELARDQGVGVLLAGDGGDEIFGGNERYRTDRVLARYHRIPSLVRRGAIEPLVAALPAIGPLARARRYIARATLPNPRRFYFYEFFFAQAGFDLLDPGFRAAVERDAPFGVLDTQFARPAATSELNRLLYLDLKLTIGDNDLLKVTRTAELAGVGVRFPLLDVALAEFTGALAADLKVRGLEKRYLFKRAFASLLAPETLAKAKHGFGVPTSAWLRDHPGFRALAHDTLLSARARARGYLRAGAIEELFRLHRIDPTPYYGGLLWTLLVLELWQRRHVDGRCADAGSMSWGAPKWPPIPPRARTRPGTPGPRLDPGARP
ncbi:MAG: asparagine synthase [Candidatus Rokubacteria bacterium]|nr:asparagine synthase [Candidatus Rokubacteria bacterium]